MTASTQYSGTTEVPEVPEVPPQPAVPRPALPDKRAGIDEVRRWIDQYDRVAGEYSGRTQHVLARTSSTRTSPYQPVLS